MLQNAYFLAKIGADTAENEQHFAEKLPKIGNYPTGPSGAEGADREAAGRAILRRDQLKPSISSAKVGAIKNQRAQDFLRGLPATGPRFLATFLKANF